jgi:hypothetical protein
MADWIDTGWHWLKGAVLIGLIFVAVVFISNLIVTPPRSTLAHTNDVTAYVDRVHASGLLMRLNCQDGTAHVSRYTWNDMTFTERTRFTAMMSAECHKPVTVNP